MSFTEHLKPKRFFAYLGITSDNGFTLYAVALDNGGYFNSIFKGNFIECFKIGILFCHSKLGYI